MSILTGLLLALAVVIVLFVIIVSTRPDSFRITRSTTMSAPVAVVFAQVNDFHKWTTWSPWEKMDPALKRTYDGPPSGVGTHYTWSGNNKVGEGAMTITESRTDELIRIKLEFIRPMKAVNDTEFAFKPENNYTSVIWTMTGKCNFVAKIFHLFMNMDKMVGGDFEKGLAQMKAVSEAAAKQPQTT